MAIPISECDLIVLKRKYVLEFKAGWIELYLEIVVIQNRLGMEYKSLDFISVKVGDLLWDRRLRNCSSSHRF